MAVNNKMKSRVSYTEIAFEEDTETSVMEVYVVAVVVVVVVVGDMELLTMECDDLDPYR